MPSLGWRRVAVLLVVAAALTFLVKVAASGEDLAAPRETPAAGGVPTALQAAVDSVFEGRSCVAPGEAEAAIRARLIGSDYASWTITSTGTLPSAGCVVAGFDLVERVIVLVRVARLEVRQVMEDVRHELLRTCLQRDAAIEYLRGVLRALGEPDPEIRTDGPITFPVAAEEETRRHIEAGCYLYSGAIWNDAGDPVYLLGGEAAP
jgi:hypothetical protein